MKVERVYTRSIVCTPRGATLEEAAETMRRHHVGALLVFEMSGASPQVAGIVTDRDLVVLGLAEGLNARKMKVEAVMAPIVASVPEEADILEALERMRAAGTRRLLVTKAREPTGIVSIDDIVDALAAELASAAAILKNEIRREADVLGDVRLAGTTAQEAP